MHAAATHRTCSGWAAASTGYTMHCWSLHINPMQQPFYPRLNHRCPVILAGGSQLMLTQQLQDSRPYPSTRQARTLCSPTFPLCSDHKAPIALGWHTQCSVAATGRSPTQSAYSRVLLVCTELYWPSASIKQRTSKDCTEHSAMLAQALSLLCHVLVTAPVTLNV
jgi:hypothetical protein